MKVDGSLRCGWMLMALVMDDERGKEKRRRGGEIKWAEARARRPTITRAINIALADNHRSRDGRLPDHNSQERAKPDPGVLPALIQQRVSD